MGLDIVPATPAGSNRLSPDRRLPHILALTRSTTCGERCDGVQATCTLSTPGGLRTPLERRAGWPRRIWPEITPARTVRSRNSAKRALVARRSFSSHRVAQAAAARRKVKKQLSVPIGWGNTPRQERERERERESHLQPTRRQLAKAGPHRGETWPPSRTAGTDRQGRTVQRWRGLLRPRRDFLDAGAPPFGPPTFSKFGSPPFGPTVRGPTLRRLVGLKRHRPKQVRPGQVNTFLGLNRSGLKRYWPKAVLA